MNHKPSGSLCLSKAIEGFIYYKTAEGLSPNTLIGYRHDLKLLMSNQGDVEVSEITPKAVSKYLTWLRTEYKPRRFSRKQHKLSNKSIRNAWASLSSFFSWASLEFNIPDPMDDVPAPKYSKAPMEYFTKEEIEALIKECEYSRVAEPVDRRKFVMRRPTARRDRAIILALLDTGLRASELCALRVDDIDLKTGKVNVRHNVGGSKGGKGRTVFLGKNSRRVMWRYLAEREDGDQPDAPLFLGMVNRPMNPASLRHLIRGLGEKAGVKKCHPHRFRHTFAITYLRSGGDIFTLQSLLGHTSLDMVRHYARVAEVDVEQAHRKASPVDNWRL